MAKKLFFFFVLLLIASVGNEANSYDWRKSIKVSREFLKSVRSLPISLKILQDEETEGGDLDNEGTDAVAGDETNGDGGGDEIVTSDTDIAVDGGTPDTIVNDAGVPTDDALVEGTVDEVNTPDGTVGDDVTVDPTDVTNSGDDTSGYNTDDSRNGGYPGGGYKTDDNGIDWKLVNGIWQAFGSNNRQRGNNRKGSNKRQGSNKRPGSKTKPGRSNTKGGNDNYNNGGVGQNTIGCATVQGLQVCY